MLNDVVKLQNMSDIWQDLLPAKTYVSYGTLDENFPELSAIEQNSFGLVSHQRRREIQAGRMHGKNALLNMNIYGVDIPKNFNGSPKWPLGTVGSITHTQHLAKSYVAATVASSEYIQALGIDVQWLDLMRPDLWSYFLTNDEINCLLQQQLTKRNILANSIWCLKESAIKAVGYGDMLSWQVTYQSFNVGINEFILSNKKARSKCDLTGKSVNYQGLTLAAVYSVNKH